MFLDAILDGDSLIRDAHLSVIVEWRSARTLRQVRASSTSWKAIPLRRSGPQRRVAENGRAVSRSFTLRYPTLRNVTIRKSISPTLRRRQFVDAVRTLVTDAHVVFQRGAPLANADRQGHRLWDNRFIDSVKVQAMDASHVSLVMAVMADGAFMGRPRMYTPETETNIGMNLNQVAKVLRCADDDDRVVLISDSDPRIGRVFMYIYRPNPAKPDMSFFGDLYDEGGFSDVFHNGDPNRRLRVQLKPRENGCGDDGSGGDQETDGGRLLPHKEMLFDLPKVYVDEPAIGVPPTPPGFTIVMPSRAFAEIAEHLTGLADTLDISVFLDTSSADLTMEDEDAMIHVRHKVVFSSTYGTELTGRHELRTRRELVELDRAMDIAEDETAVITVMKPEDIDEEDLKEEQQGDKMVSGLLITLSFASRYMETFSKAASICDVVQLQMNEDSPIGVSYLGENGVLVRYFLAPKVQDD